MQQRQDRLKWAGPLQETARSILAGHKGCQGTQGSPEVAISYRLHATTSVLRPTSSLGRAVKPSTSHTTPAKKLLRYQPNIYAWFNHHLQGGSVHHRCYTYAFPATNPDDWGSTTSYLFLVSGRPLCSGAKVPGPAAQ